MQVLQFTKTLLICSISTWNGNPYCKTMHHTAIHVFNPLGSIIKKRTSFIQQLVVQPNSTPCAMQILHHHHSNQEPQFYIDQAQNYLPRNACWTCPKLGSHHAERSTWLWPHANKEPQNRSWWLLEALWKNHLPPQPHPRVLPREPELLLGWCTYMAQHCPNQHSNMSRWNHRTRC